MADQAALLATDSLGAVSPLAEPEGTAFCQILSNSFNSWQRRLHGDILLNGVSVSPARLQDRVAYVRRNNAFGADMSVRQTMLFHSFLREPGTHSRARDAKGRVSQISISYLCPHFTPSVAVASYVSLHQDTKTDQIHLHQKSTFSARSTP